jgi:hypothetical protein
MIVADPRHDKIAGSNIVSNRGCNSIGEFVDTLALRGRPRGLARIGHRDPGSPGALLDAALAVHDRMKHA